MAYGTVQADVIGTSVAGSNLGAGDASMLKNRIINGAMVIDQRNSGASVTNTTSSIYCVDRWFIQGSVSSKFSAQQTTTAPAGFVNSWKFTSLSAYTPSGSDYFQAIQAIEGYNIADLGWGTANAKTVTLSFQVYSSLTGTFGGGLTNSAFNRSYPFNFTISSANTWQQVSITIAGDTTGTWATDNSAGIQVRINLGVGSTYAGTANSWQAGGYIAPTGLTQFVGTNGATFYITGVQLEVGSSATGFEYRQYGQELALCQRYFEQWNGGSQYAPMGMGQIGNGNGFTYAAVPLVYKRTTPTVSLSSLAGGTIFSAYGTNASGGSFPWSGNITVDTSMTGNLGIDLQSALGNSTAGGAGTCVYVILRANQYIQFSAEL